MAEPVPPRRIPHSRAVVCAGAAVWIACACTGSPKPEPPITVPRPPTLERSLVSWRALSGDGATVLVGSAGAVEPAAGYLRAYNLDDTAAAVEAPVAEDGGFELGLGVATGDEVRLEVIGLEASSGPSDLRIGELGAPLTPVSSALRDCLALDPGRLMWVAAGADGELRAEDVCGRGLELGAPRPRTELDRVAVGSERTWPVALEPGAPISITVQILSGEPGDEYLFFLEATAPEPERWAVSVRLEE